MLPGREISNGDKKALQLAGIYGASWEKTMTTFTPTWSYAEVTAAAEKEIRWLMGQQTADDREAQQYQAWAYGVYCGWSQLTIGWWENGDNARLRALTRRPPAGA